jgi:nucleoporin SEH1
LDFLNIRHETYLALITRDVLLSLVEPVDVEKFDDWKELDQSPICVKNIR